jgi:aminoglycoside 3-N-acetyltransferase
MPYTSETIAGNLNTLGVKRADILFIHSSFKSLGTIEDGAESVVRALEIAVGPDGLILMPSFNLVEADRRARSWNIETTPSTVGWLTEFFRLMPGTHRSDHYSHSVAARGKYAHAFVADHASLEGLPSPWDLPPWGKTYGTRSPMVKAYNAEGMILMIGVDYSTSTYIHLVETFYWDKCRSIDDSAKYRYLKRPELGEFWENCGRLHKGSVGNAQCRMFSIRNFVDTLLAEVERDPAPYFR